MGGRHRKSRIQKGERGMNSARGTRMHGCSGTVRPDPQCAPRSRRVHDDPLGPPGSPEGLRASSRSRLRARPPCEQVPRENSAESRGKTRRASLRPPRTGDEKRATRDPIPVMNGSGEERMPPLQGYREQSKDDRDSGSIGSLEPRGIDKFFGSRFEGLR